MGALIDTNVLVYTLDVDEAEKRQRAQALLRLLQANKSGAVCAQVLGEHQSVVSRRFAHIRGPGEAVMATERWARAFPVHDTTLRVVLEALRATVRYQMPYYDAQIWAVARVHHIPLVLSEDFTDGAVIEGVRFANPFAEGFDLDAALQA
ncbi:MAG: PIN domain-containing protein [Coriobacteriia bacterium]